jgi:hypothetical protein
MAPAIARDLRQLFLSPTKFFEDRPPRETLLVAAGLVALFAISLTVTLLLVGSMLAGAVDTTVTMDNPDRPPEPICEQYADDPDSAFGEGCDEPETVERDAGQLVQQAVHDHLWIGVVAPLVLWILGTIVLFAGGRLAAGDPSLSGTAALAGWAALPEFIRLVVGVTGLWYVLQDLTIRNPEQGAEVLETAMTSVEPVLLGASFITLVWQWTLLSAGLSGDADISWSAAASAVGIPLLIVFILGVL